MNRSAIAPLLASACVLASCNGGSRSSAAANLPSVIDASVQRAIVAAVEKDRKLYGGRTPVPGVLVGVWDGKGGSFVHPFGYADLKAHRPLSAADHFRIGSNTKTFVVAVILQLADEGKLALDDTVSKFDIGVTVPNGGKITVRELCDMRSGLFEAYDVPQFKAMTTLPAKWDPRAVIAWAAEQKPYFAPGQGYHYSNTNYLILGLIIQNLTHDSVGNEIEKRLIGPYELTHTVYPTNEAMPSPWARGYGLDAKRNWEDVSNTIPVEMMGAAGAMISDMSDMKRWIALYVGGKTSSATMHEALMDCIPTGTPNEGFGLALGCSHGWYGYTGGLPGYNTANFYFPQSGAFVVAWVDVQNNNPRPGVANAIFRDIAAIITPNNAPLQNANGL
jgi:D-alanyl-D-alanine carboxypeptidase